jgi:hypothetical protein
MFICEIEKPISPSHLSFAHPPGVSPHILAIPSLFLTAHQDTATFPVDRLSKLFANLTRVRLIWGKHGLYWVVRNLRPFPSSKKCAHKNKLREESIACRHYIKFSEWLMAMQ